jgi:outer membrane immunogenic protein
MAMPSRHICPDFAIFLPRFLNHLAQFAGYSSCQATTCRNTRNSKMMSTKNIRAGSWHAARIASLAALSVATLMAAPLSSKAADIYTGADTSTVEPGFDPIQNSSIWTGPYAGLYGALKWQSVGVMGGSDVDLNANKQIGGYVGINQELGNSLIGGLEWQGGFSGKSETNGGITAEQDWETSLRARMGYAVEQNLFYGLAGLGATRVSASDASGSDQNWLTGWTVGAGVEHQFSDRISGRLEYDYSKYGAQKFDLGSSSPDIGLTGHGLKLGVGYKF